MSNGLIVLVMALKPQTVGLPSALVGFQKVDIFPWLHVGEQLWVGAVAFMLGNDFEHAAGWKRQKEEILLLKM